VNHDTFCLTFHQKELPVELCNNCDAISSARRDERRRMEQEISRLQKTYPHLDKFSDGYTFALERVTALVRSS